MGAELAIPAVAAPLIGGVLGMIESEKNRKAAQAAMRAALDEINKVGAPPDLSKAIIIGKLQDAGVYTPDMEQHIDVGVSQLSQVQEDPALRQAQTLALSKMAQRSAQGMSPEERAALNQMRQQIGADTQARNQAILQNMQQRGMGSAGAALAAQLANSQQAQNTASMQGDQLAANASMQALQALGQYGNMASGVRGQDFDIAGQKANAADQFQRFNIQNQLGQQERNVGATNTGKQYNLGIKQQDIANQNKELYRQADAKRQNWADQLTLAQAKANAQTGNAQFQAQQGAQTAAQYTGMGNAAGQGFGAIYKADSGKSKGKYDPDTGKPVG